MKKKEYSNIFAKMIVLHNEETSPFIKELKSGSLKIRKNNIHLDLNRLESEDEKLGNCYNHKEYFYEYLLMNRFLIQFIDKKSYKECLDLLHNSDYRDLSNMIISANIVYNLIEEKKLEIISKLNENK